MLHSLAAVERQKKSIKKFANNLKQYCTYGMPSTSNYEYGQLQKKISNFGSMGYVPYQLEQLVLLFNDKCLMCRIPNIFDEFEKQKYMTMPSTMIS